MTVQKFFSKRVQHITTSPFETKKLAEDFAKNISKRGFYKKALVLALTGDLGGGKTTFLQGFAKGLGIKEKILSPTFILMKKFQIPNFKFQILKFKTFYHIDCYRIENSREILDLGFKEIISGPKNIVAIEWADQLGKELPKNVITLSFDFLDKKTRKITISEN